ncbi:MAG: TPM domain-containing protein [Clostridiales bacterium]|nr:TPM domain-containing protein [Clostridiales bacterium]
MVKKIAAALIALMALASAALAAPLVSDNAALLSDEAAARLTETAERLSQEYQMDVAIATAQGTEGRQMRHFTADYYDNNGYGQGPEHDGVMLMLAMAERDWFILTTGRAIAAFTDDTLGAIGDDVVPYLSRGDYEGGFARFLRDAEIVLRQAQTGEPYDVGHRAPLRTPVERLAGAIWYLVAAAALIAGGAVGIMAFAMNTARPQRGAGRYVRDGSMAIGRSSDIYLYHTQTRVRAPKNESGKSGGGSSTFSSSGGRSHGGSGGKF